ncbi:MAG TPA: SANT/Myb-like DNA-binding domain-containing protein [Anaerolineae bacterium]|nr:SANT/Myb-like DNA-binding domain-containing protein [Anaerolineae bacterium]
MSPRRTWTSDEDRELLQLRKDEISWKECAEVLGKHPDAVRSHYRYLKTQGLTEEKEEPVFEIEVEVDEFDEQVTALLGDEKPQDPIHWRRLISLASDTQGAMEGLQPAKDIRVCKVPGKPYPIGVFSGDWHLGSKATDYPRWLYEVSMILRSENTFLFDLGDDRQNSRSTRHLAWVLGQVLPVELQAQVIVSFTQEMVRKGKLKAKIGGTHDHWFDEGVAGQSLLRWLYQQNETIAFFENKGLLLLQVDFDGEEKEYPHLLFHKARYRSFLSTLHSNRREYQMTFPGKVVAGAHDHIPGAEIFWHYGLVEKAGYDIGGWSWMIKVGAFTSAENQFRDLGSFNHRTEVFCPACVYMPEGIVLLPTLRDALAFRAGIGAARDHEEAVIDELDVSAEQKEKLKEHLLRRFRV